MPAKKRTPIQIEDDRRETASLYLQGKTQQAIAERLGMTRQMVGYDLKAIQRRWRQDTARDLDEDKAKELAKLDELERTHWQAWEDSLERAGQYGNPAYLRGVIDCIDRRCKLLGLDSPQKLEHSGKDGGPIQVDVAAIEAKILALGEAEQNEDS